MTGSKREGAQNMDPIYSIPRKDALRLIRAKTKQIEEVETIPLQQSCGRVTAEDVVSLVNLPDAPCSRWDGISFSFARYAECNGDVSQWEDGRDYLLTNTGIVIPDARFDTMVKIEDTEWEAGCLKAIIQREPVRLGQNVTPIGYRMKLGEVLAKKDTLITPSYMSLFASGGNLSIPVYRKPVIALLATGNELVPRGQRPCAGQIIEANTCSMQAKIAKWGGSSLIYPIVRDDLALLTARLKEAASAADLVIISGGTGRGQHDLLYQALSAAGETCFTRVEHGPGRRTSLSVVNGTPVIGLVGPPGGEEMTFDFYVIPALRWLQHQSHHETKVNVILDDDATPHSRADFYFSLKIYPTADGTLHALPLSHGGFDRSIADHNGYLFVPKDSGGYSKGSAVGAELRIGYENI